jgi:uncharacterized protein YdhG (YjbR/CyaY superfamily)
VSLREEDDEQRTEETGGNVVSTGNRSTRAKTTSRARPEGPHPGAPKDFDEYVSRLPADSRATLEAMRKTIRSVAPEAEEVISYQLPTFRYHGLLVAIGARPNHCALYVLNPAVMDQLGKELARYDTSKGTIRFPIGKPMPAALLRKIVKARMAQNLQKSAGGAR